MVDREGRQSTTIERRRRSQVRGLTQDELTTIRKSWTKRVWASVIRLAALAAWCYLSLAVVASVGWAVGEEHAGSEVQSAGFFDLQWQLGIEDQDAYVIATALLVLVATLGVAVVASGLSALDDPRDDVELHFWAQLLSTAARLAAMGAFALGLSRSNAPVSFVVLTGVGLLAILIASAIVERETDQLNLRLRLAALSNREANLLAALDRADPNADQHPTSRSLLKDWACLIAGVVLTALASIAIAVAIYVAGPGAHQDLAELGIISIALTSTGILAAVWALAAVTSCRARVRYARPWGLALELYVSLSALLFTLVVVSIWTKAWFLEVMLVSTVLSGVLLGRLGVRGRGPYRVARTSAIAAVRRDLDRVVASLSDVRARIPSRRTARTPQAFGRPRTRSRLAYGQDRRARSPSTTRWS